MLGIAQNPTMVALGRCTDLHFQKPFSRLLPHSSFALDEKKGGFYIWEEEEERFSFAN